MPALSCHACDAPLPAENRFCGACGTPVAAEGGALAVAGPPGAVAAPSPVAPSALRRYRGPLWVGGIGGVLLAAGGGVATAILSTVQLEVGTGLLLDLVTPVIDDQIPGTVVEDAIGLGTGDTLGTLSVLTLIALATSILIAGIGLLMLVIGLAWGANRGFGSRSSGTVTVAAPPPVITYPPPAFATAPPPTFTTPPPPAPASPVPPPTFTTQRQPPDWPAPKA